MKKELAHWWAVQRASYTQTVHCIKHTVKELGTDHRPVTISEGGKIVELSCMCGKVFYPITKK